MRILTEKQLNKIVDAALSDVQNSFNGALDDLIKQAKEWESTQPTFTQERAEALAKLKTLHGIKDMFNYFIKFKFWHYSEI